MPLSTSSCTRCRVLACKPLGCAACKQLLLYRCQQCCQPSSTTSTVDNEQKACFLHPICPGIADMPRCSVTYDNEHWPHLLKVLPKLLDEGQDDGLAQLCRLPTQHLRRLEMGTEPDDDLHILCAQGIIEGLLEPAAALAGVIHDLQLMKNSGDSPARHGQAPKSSKGAKATLNMQLGR